MSQPPERADTLAAGFASMRTPHIVWGFLFCIAYIGCAWLSFNLQNVNTFAAPIWLPTGIALAAVLLRGYRMWPWIAAGALAVNLYLGAPFISALGVSVGNTLEAVLGAYVLTRFTTVSDLFRKQRATLIFIATAAGITTLSASVGVASLLMGGSLSISQVPVTWLAWWAGDTLGALVLTPFLLTWFTPYRYPVASLRMHMIEAGLLCLATLATNLLTFLPPAIIPQGTPLLYLVVLPLAWSALRFGPRGVATAIFFNLAVAVAATLAGKGPFASPHFLDGLIFLQFYIYATSATFLVFAAIVKEHKNTSDTLEEFIKRQEHSLQKIRSEDQAKTDFLAVLAHELRNPLAPALSSLEIIKLKGLKSPDSEKALSVIHDELKSMSRLLDDLLDISRISKGKMGLQKEVMDFRIAATHALEVMQERMSTKQHRIIVSLPEEPLWIEADPLRIEQIILNILNNARKYTNPNGTIRISASSLGSLLVFRVKDDGIGIEREMLQQIFEPFLQAAHESRKPSAGLGIGLSLTKRLVELHGGSIEALSEGLGLGSEFVITLPSLSREERLEARQPALSLRKLAASATSSMRKKTRRVLVVDDNRLAAIGLAKLLDHVGYKAKTAYDGVEAIEAVQHFKPHIAVLDLGLPEMDGHEIARRLRKIDPKIFLVAVTGYGQEEDREQTKASGFNHHLVKPVSITQLKEILAEVE